MVIKTSTKIREDLKTRVIRQGWGVTLLSVFFRKFLWKILLVLGGNSVCKVELLFPASFSVRDSGFSSLP